MRNAEKTILIAMLFWMAFTPDCWPKTTYGQAKSHVVHFPKDRSLGNLLIQDVGVKRQIESFYHWVGDAKWEYLGQARGDVSVPAGKRLALHIPKNAIYDLSPLSELGPNELYGLSLRNTPADDGCMPHISHLTGLRVLNLGRTNITSKGIRFIKNMKSLECLYASEKIANGGLGYISRLPSLKRLYIKKSSLTNSGLRHLSNLPTLEELEIGEGKINDEGLAHLVKLPSLTYLMIWGETFSDKGMAHLKDIPSLRILHLGSVPAITDVGVEHLSLHDKLESINFYWNRNITNQGAVYLSRMKSLKKLNVGHSQINDDGLSHLSKVKTLEYLVLPHSGITDTGLVHVIQLENLKYLKVGSAGKSPLTDKSLSCVGKLKNLQKLQIGGAGFSDEGMDYIVGLHNLKKLSLSKADQLTNTGLAKLGRLKSLTELMLGNSPNISIAGLKSLNTLKNLKSLNIRKIAQDNSVMDISGLISLERLELATPRRPGTSVHDTAIHDEDFACLAKLKNLRYIQTNGHLKEGVTALGDAGMAHLPRLTNLDSLYVSGTGITDKGLSFLADKKNMYQLSINGNFTDTGLRYLEGLKRLLLLNITSKNTFRPAALNLSLIHISEPTRPY